MDKKIIMKTKNPVILIIRDGWGYRKEKKDNYIALSNTPWDDLFSKIILQHC